MSSDLEFIAMIALIFIVSIFYIANKPRNETEPKPKTTKEIVKKKDKVTSDKVIDTLDWMLANNIIDSKEYTKLMGKCLQYM